MTKKEDLELEKFEKETSSIHKYLLTLSVTVFGSSIALANGKDVNIFFIFGEFLLFISSVLGVFLLLSRLKNIEFDYILSLKQKKLDDKLLKSCDNILKKNQSGLLYSIFKKIKYENIFSVFIWTLIFGMFLIMFSLLFLQNIIIIHFH